MMKRQRTAASPASTPSLDEELMMMTGTCQEPAAKRCKGMAQDLVILQETHQAKASQPLVASSLRGLFASANAPVAIAISDAEEESCIFTHDSTEEEATVSKTAEIAAHLKDHSSKLTEQPVGSENLLEDDTETRMMEWMISPVFLRDYHQGICLRKPIEDMDDIFA